MVVEKYIIIGRIVEVNCEYMMDFGSKIRKNKGISDYSRWDLIPESCMKIDENLLIM